LSEEYLAVVRKTLLNLPIRYTLGGGNVAKGQGVVDITVLANPVPSAQLAIKVFHDNAPLNAFPDVPEEGLEGFSVLLFDAGGQVTAIPWVRRT
jgi:hypothetical protein